MGPDRRLVAVATTWLIGACTCGHARPDPARPTGASPQGGRAAPTRPAIPRERACGEVGASPTELPEAVATGMTGVGGGRVRLGETRTFGTVSVEYDPSAWHGTMEIGHRAPGLTVLMPQEEASGGPWGTAPQELAPNAVFRTGVGPYRVDVRASGESPPQSVDVDVTRRSCPDHATVPLGERPVWFWLSTEALQLHTLMTAAGEMMQLSLLASPEGPRLDLTYGPQRHWLVPRAGERRTIRSRDRAVTIDEVVLGAPRPAGAACHVRVRVDPVPPAADPAPSARAAPAPCGAPGPVATTLPPELTAAPVADADARIAVGETRRVGPLEASYEPQTLPGIGREPPTQTANLVVRDGPRYFSGPLSFGLGGDAARAAREDRRLLRIDALDTAAIPRLRLRTAPMRCAKSITVAPPDAPLYVWLSTVGNGLVWVGPESRPIATLQLYDGAVTPSLGLASPNALVSGALSPDLVGQAFTLDSVRVEVLDLQTSGDTRRAGDRWVTSGLVPLVHLLLRLDHEPGAAASSE